MAVARANKFVWNVLVNVVEILNAIKGQIRNFITEKKVAIFDHLILFALAFVPFWRMGYTGLWREVHMDFSQYPIENFLNSLYTWDRQFTGFSAVSSFSIQSLWPYKFFWATLTSFGITPDMTLRVYLVSMFALLGWSMYYMMGSVFRNQEETTRRIVCMTASIFYMVNPYVIHRLYGSLHSFLLQGVMLPFAFAFLHKGFDASQKDGNWIKYAVLVAFSSTVLLTGHVAIAILAIIFLAAYAICHLLLDLYRRQLGIFANKFKFILISAFVSFVINLWWLLILIYTFLSTTVIQSMYISSYPFYTLENFSKNLASVGGFLRVIRLQIFLEFRIPIVPPYWNEWVASPLNTSVGLFLAALMILSILLKMKNKKVIFLMITTLISLGFATGLNWPFGPVFRWLYDNILIFRVLHTPDKFLFIAVFGYAALLGLTVGELFRRISDLQIKFRIKAGWLRYFRGNLGAPFIIGFLVLLLVCAGLLFQGDPGLANEVVIYAYYLLVIGVVLQILGKKLCAKPNMASKVFVIVMVCLVFVNSYPLFSGNLGGVMDPTYVPSYYTEAREWLLQQDGDFRVLIVPQGEYSKYPEYSWGPKYSTNPIPEDIFPIPVLDRIYLPKYTVSPSGNLSQYLYTLIDNYGTRNAGKLLAQLNVKYICVLDDRLEPGTTKEIGTTAIKSALEAQEDIELAKTFGQLHFYENKAYNRILIYGSTSYVVLPRFGSESLFYYTTLSNLEDFEPLSTVFLSSQRLPEDVLLNEIVDTRNVTDIYYGPLSDWTTLSNGDQLTDWISMDASLVVDSSDYKEGNASIKAVSYAPSKFPPSELIYSLYAVTGPQDWSRKDVIEFWFKSSSVKAKYSFMAFDINDISLYWEFEYYEPNTWQRIRLPLIEAQRIAPSNLEKINKFKIQVFEPTPAENVTYWIDGIEIGKVALPNVFLSWNESGVYTSYVRVNPTRYVVHVEAEEPFVLVLSESYDPGWTARVEGTSTVLEHFPVNFYANGWYINKTGENRVILNYKPQEYLTIGIVASTTTATILITLVILRTYLTKAHIRRRYEKEKNS